jgi:release factor glutamine methyltransferase
MSEAHDRAWTLSDILGVTVGFLARKNPGSSPRLDAELLLSRVLGIPRVGLYLNFDRILDPGEVAAFRELVRRRGQHEPVAYILGEKEFYGIPLKVDARALIPRPETEHLVDEALRILKASGKPAPRVADVGCGSGAIALTLARLLPEALVEASDVSPGALGLASENAEALGLAQRVRLLQGDLLDAPFSEGPFDLICANLPYVPSEDIPSLPPDILLFEPMLALDGGPLGLGPYRGLLAAAPGRLAPSGHLILEIHPAQYQPLRELCESHGLEAAEAVKDFSKKDRIFVARAKGQGEA